MESFPIGGVGALEIARLLDRDPFAGVLRSVRRQALPHLQVGVGLAKQVHLGKPGIQEEKVIREPRWIRVGQGKIVRVCECACVACVACVFKCVTLWLESQTNNDSV